MRDKTPNKINAERQYWLWVTQPEYYLNEEGDDREDINPSSGLEDLWGSWTCSKRTQKGDLALLWRSKGKLKQYLASLGVKRNINAESDIGYLFQAKSDAFTTEEGEVQSKGWRYYCEMMPVYKFRVPLTISEIKMNPYLQELKALRAKFQGSYFEFSHEDWERLNQQLMDRNPGYRKVLERIEKRRIPVTIDVEEQMEDQLAKNPRILRIAGFNLDLFGRQMVCIGGEGRIDLLLHDKKKKCYVVVELKNVRAGQNTFGQISNYIGWVKNRIAGNQSVKGLVISRGKDLKFENAMKSNPNISQFNIEDFGFK